MVRASAAQDNEELPEADRLENFPHPRETHHLYGHEAAERMLAGAFATGRMHHGWLLAGPEGVGKATLAYRVARHVLSPAAQRDAAGQALDVPIDSGAARQVRALSHPGLLVLRRTWDARSKRFSASIPVDEIRRLRSFLGLTAGEAAWRVVIVDRADELNPSAANALLKSLEEPPARVLFLLVTSVPGSLLPTIRSRCRRLDLAPLDFEPLKAAAEAALSASRAPLPEPTQWRRLEGLAGGSVRRALQLTSGGGLELAERIDAILASLPEVDWAAAHGLSDQLSLSTQAQRFEAFCDLLLDALAVLVRARAGGHAEAKMRALSERLIRPERLPEWAALWQDLLQQKNDTVLLNLDRKAFVLAAVARIQEAARR
jgi:DNA polymerase-3 subunit delta'